MSVFAKPGSLPAFSIPQSYTPYFSMFYPLLDPSVYVVRLETPGTMELMLHHCTLGVVNGRVAPTFQP